MSIFKKRSILGFKGQKRDLPVGLWQKCLNCKELISEVELIKKYRICPKCGYYFILNAIERIRLLTDCYEISVNDDSDLKKLNTTLPKNFEEMDKDLISIDKLNFLDYKKKLDIYREKLKINEAVITGVTEIKDIKLVLVAMDFRFLGASMGSVVGEKITRAIETATEKKLPIVIVSSSGGARMHEGIMSLMQMAKTCAALARHSQAFLPYISLLTHPTTGGVTASFATLGDINIAEPGCMIGFAGPRVIKETTHQNLPDGFQTSEFMLEHGLIDRIVSRNDLAKVIAQILSYL